MQLARSLAADSAGADVDGLSGQRAEERAQEEGWQVDGGHTREVVRERKRQDRREAQQGDKEERGVQRLLGDGHVDGCGAWIGGVANLWRTVGDVQATWASVMANIHANDKMAPVVNGGQGTRNGQGNFNDADMLEVGNVGLTVVEQYTMMSLWSLAGSPLLAGTDIVHASATTLAILANKEVTAINQDLGLDGKVQGVLVGSKSRGLPAAGGEGDAWRDAQSEVWCKPLADGKSVALVLLNLDDDAPLNLTATWTELGLRGEATVRDLWAQRTLDPASGALTAEVPPHGTRMFKLTTAARVLTSAASVVVVESA